MNHDATMSAWIVSAAFWPLAGLTQDVNPAAWFRDFQRSFDAIRGEDCDQHLAAALTVASAPEFGSVVSRDGQLAYLRAFTDCAMDHDQYESGFRAAELWVARAPDETWPQAIRYGLGASYDRPEATLDAFARLAKIAPDYIRQFELSQVWIAVRAARELGSDGERLLEVYETLRRLQYVPLPPAREDGLRFDHARLLLDRGRLDDARERMAGVDSVRLLAGIRIDRRYDALRRELGFEARLDLAAAADREVLRSRAAMTAHPALLQVVHGLVEALRVAHRPDEALEVADAALARLSGDENAFEDAAEYRPWMLNTRGYILYDLGRVADARQSLREAAGLPEDGEPNVSNIINFMEMLLNEGLATEAAALIPAVGQPSPYGQAWVEATRSCAGVQLGNEEMRLAGLEYLRAHEADNPAALSKALLCSDDRDAVAALFIKRLADPENRGDALLALQVVPSAADAWFPFRRQLLERLDAVRARADVRAAVDAVGRVETLPVRLSVGDF